MGELRQLLQRYILQLPFPIKPLSVYQNLPVPTPKMGEPYLYYLNYLDRNLGLLNRMLNRHSQVLFFVLWTLPHGFLLNGNKVCHEYTFKRETEILWQKILNEFQNGLVDFCNRDWQGKPYPKEIKIVRHHSTVTSR